MMLNTFFPLVSRRLLWGLLGVTALSALIWMMGPLLPFPRFQALDNPLNRQLLIGLSYFLWILFQLIPQLYRAWFNSKLLTRLQLSSSDHAELQATSEMLDNRFSEAAMLLKKTQFGKRGGGLRRFSAQYLYQLPWYLIVGAPGAGKTTALINSGLDFPLSDAMGKTALRGIGGTRHCDWWFTGEAVLLDTAGRYTLQESQRIRDASEWQTFITLLKRYRPRQPINGVIMTLSISDLLSDSAEVRHTQAVALRQRLTELHKQTGIPFPVYIMVTKTDLLKGFTRYFSRLDKQQREQILGFTFPWEPDRQHGRQLHAQFEQQFTRIFTGLMSNLGEKMAQESDLTLRAECFQFPQEFSALRPLLAEYLDVVFSPDDSETPWAARGLFFTSGTQEGLPFDRVMGELSRKLQLPQPQGQSIASWDSVNRSAPIPANKGQSYFIHGMLRDVVFKESRLAGSDRSWEQRNRLLHRAGYIALGVALLAASALWVTSYYKNQHYLEEVSSRLPAVTRQAEQLTGNNHGDILDLLPFLNTLVALPETSQFSLNAPPLTIRGGLYRADQIGDATWGLYQGALKSLLLPRVAHTITQTLRNDDGKDAEFSRNALRAYQMLYQPRSYDGEFLRGWVMQNLQRSLPPGVTTQQLQQLDWHLSQLLDHQILSSPYLRDNALMVRKLVLNVENAGRQGNTTAETTVSTFSARPLTTVH